MKTGILHKSLRMQEGEEGRVILLLLASFFMGAFLATFTVAAQTLFLNNFDEQNDLPGAFAIGGAFGLVATIAYNFLQRKISFRFLAILSLLVVTVITAAIEYGRLYVEDINTIYYYGFTQLVPFTLIVLLVFWGTFNRFFNVRQSKRLVGTVDQGALVASVISFFLIPVVLPSLGDNETEQAESLYTISLVSIIIFTVLFIVLSAKFGGEQWSLAKERETNIKIAIPNFFKSRYLILLSVFIIVSIIALNFVQYSFLSVSTQRLKPEQLATFLALFEATVVIFAFLADTLTSERVLQDYGLRVAILINPAMIGIFTVAALIIGWAFGYTQDSPSFTIFFVMVAMSLLIIGAAKEAFDEPAFKLYQLPIDSNIKIDVQTKIEGIAAALGTMIAGGLIYLINRVHVFNLLHITLFTIPIVALWYFVGTRMYTNYRKTLRSTLIKNKANVEHTIEQEFTVDRVLEREITSSAEDKVLFGLRFMEKIEPALFENAIITLANSSHTQVRTFANEKIQQLGLDKDPSKDNDIRTLASQAQGATEDSDLLSIPPENLMKLSKSVKAADRMLAAKLLRKLISQRTIFILLELLRDVDYNVRHEALKTARKVKRPETWPTLIELLSSSSYCHQATAALIEAGEPVLPVLDTAFHKSGQNDVVMLRLVQIVGRIGGDAALDLLWKKADYPDKRIVNQILYSLRYVNYRATGRQANQVMDLLDAEIGKNIWNQAALHELPQTDTFRLLRSALREEIRINNDQITMLLSILYDPEAIQLVRENIDSGDPNGVAYAIELMDLFVDPDLKPKLFPLYDDIPMSRKLELLQPYFPRENYNPIQVINFILNRDFNLNNRWTKVCAVYTSAYLNRFRVSRGLIAQMFNRDKLLQETAAWVIYNKNKNTYHTISERLPHRDKRYLDSAIENNQLLDGLNDGFFLGIEMIMFLKQLPEFNGISGVLLAHLFDKIQSYDLQRDEKLRFTISEQSNPVFIVAHGKVYLKENDITRITLKPGDVYGDLFSINRNGYNLNTVEAAERSVVFRIDLMDFYFVIANHHEMVEKIIRNATENEKAITEPEQQR
ncbi:MAG: HEAT repeat domain-containing protein [Cyclobacteriaceae bacterium]|nr:HEAT repeat domain-containing protein [Cyclobacteriaceae bacterium]